MFKFTLINKTRNRIKVFEPFEDLSKSSPTIDAIMISYGCIYNADYSFDPKYDQELTQKYVEIFYALPKVIPCPICRSHYKKRLAYAPVEKYLSSKDKFRSWLIDIHNNVNRGLGKPTISLSYANSLYLNKDNSLKYNYQNLTL